MKKVYEIKQPSKNWIEIDNNSVTIKRKGFVNAVSQGMKGEKVIPIKSITAIQLKKASLLKGNGYIQFSIMGGSENIGGLNAAAKDENSVIFSPKYNDQMEELRDYLNNLISQDAPVSQTVINTTKSPVEQVKELKELLDAGIITSEEFETKKKEYLGL